MFENWQIDLGNWIGILRIISWIEGSASVLNCKESRKTNTISQNRVKALHTWIHFPSTAFLGIWNFVLQSYVHICIRYLKQYMLLRIDRTDKANSVTWSFEEKGAAMFVKEHSARCTPCLKNPLQFLCSHIPTADCQQGWYAENM